MGIMAASTVLVIGVFFIVVVAIVILIRFIRHR